jgi:RNA polymerase sigma-70 factor (ECF subfamily)
MDTSTHMDDEALLRRARTLDESALAAIFDRYFLPLYRYIYHHTGHVETSEDLAAEVFQRLLLHLRQGNGPQRCLKSWLYRVAHNLIVDESRRALPRLQTPLKENLPAARPDIDAQADQAILAQSARCALACLTPGQRSIIILKFLEGLDNTEIACIVDLPVGAVKSLQHRALNALRRTLAGSGHTPVEEELI